MLLYDEIAHVVTPFKLVAITAEIIYRFGGNDEFFDTLRHALITGSVISLVGAIGWELISSPPPACTMPSPTLPSTWCSV